jgi:hypothetical protein
VFENVVLSRFFEYKREGETGSWRKCLNKELHVIYIRFYMGNEIKEDELGKACSMHGKH